MSVEPVRKCVVCGVRKEKNELNRFVFFDGKIVADSICCLAGRGAYCCRNEICLEQFTQKNKRVMQAFRQK